MIILTFPAMLALLLPVVLVEALLYAKFFKSPFSKTILPAFTSNLLSTLVGIPLAWLLQCIFGFLSMFGLGIAAGYSPYFGSQYALFNNILKVIITAPWIWPSHTDGAGLLIWAVPLAALITLLPAYLISVWLEFKVIRRNFLCHDERKIKKAVRKANIVSYLGLAMFCIGLLIYCVATSTRLV